MRAAYAGRIESHDPEERQDDPAGRVRLLKVLSNGSPRHRAANFRQSTIPGSHHKLVQATFAVSMSGLGQRTSRSADKSHGPETGGGHWREKSWTVPNLQAAFFPP
jgi:hypothetical protein